jgi:CubicO group peptidase (beta-lactamase class C family)
MHKVDALAEYLKESLPDELRTNGIPGAAIGICDSHDILWSAGFGSTARGPSAPVTTWTRFSVQSTSKLFTATSVLIGVRDSLLDLDEPITTYLPEFTVRSCFETHPASKITLRHLLSHTAGFTHEAPEGSNYSIGAGSFESHCQSISDTWLRFPVGHHFEYSNLGIDLAGYILQRCSGLLFETYVQQRLIEPLGLRRSTFDHQAFLADPDRAIGHWRPFDEACEALPVTVPMVAAGGLYTSVDDALRYVQHHLRRGDHLLTANLLSEQYKISFPAPGQSLGYGLGLYLDEWDPGIRVWHHGGSGFGFQAQLLWLPDHGFGVVVLTNSFDHSLQDQLAHQIVEHLTRAGTSGPLPDGKLPSRGRVSPEHARSLEADAIDADFGDLIGEYIGRLDDLEVLMTDGSLYVRGTATETAELTNSRILTLMNPRAERFRFLTDAHGRVRYLQSLRDGQVRYKNDEGSTPPSTLAPGHAGTYLVEAWGVPVARYRIYQDGSSPVIRRLQESGGSERQGAALRLAPLGPGLYLSTMGEVLDVGSESPSYANIPLTRVPSDR